MTRRRAAAESQQEPERVQRLLAIPGLALIAVPHLGQLLRFCNEMAGFYQSPVYICGSALSKSDPRDIDLRIQLDDAEFALRYAGAMQADAAVARWIEQGLTGQWTPLRWRWSADCTKRTKRAWKLTNQNVDFQVYPLSWCEQHYADAPRIRIDEMPRMEAHP